MKAFVALTVAVCASRSVAAAVDFAAEVAPILESHCAACHSGERAAGGLAIVSRQALLEKRVLVPGKPEASSLYTLSALPSNQRRAMPPGGPRLSDAQLATLKSWIEAGAAWPADVALKTAPVSGASDEKGTVKRIHARIAGREKAAPTKAGEKYSVTIPNSTVKFDMVYVPAGEYLMGAAQSDATAAEDEKPQRRVRVDAFWMHAHEVTWDEYRLFMFQTQTGRTPTNESLVDAVAGPTRPYVEMSFGMGINGFPAISMTQHAANKYAQWLSAKTGEFYRLPTEAEWEYACRAGSTVSPSATQLGEMAWYSANSSGKYQPVAKKQPNAWGLYDMLGNVMEWTLDQYARYEPASGTLSNPLVKATAPYPHAVRGGSWNDDAPLLRCSARVPSDPSWKQQDPQLPKSVWYMTDAQWLGFRLIRPVKVPGPDEMYAYWNSGVEHDEQ